MSYWIRFAHGDRIGFGALVATTVVVHAGDMFAAPEPTGERLRLDSVRLLAPVVPSKMIALWNNYHMLGTKLGLSTPEDPLFLIKAASSYADPDAVVRRPKGYTGKVVFEGELAIVIGTRCCAVDAIEAEGVIFGYTCVNDITAADILNKDPSFVQWTRAKSFDGFSPLGPAVATGLRPETLVVRTILNGTERQNFPVSDMVFTPADLVSLLSRDMTLMPGDVICCGTSLGVGSMKESSNTVEVIIDGIGALRTRYEDSRA
jgi:2-keto-4-pentenoate hydratase/2-oxohepta-3-ene-1,7-dioic acid hydratase in catechol pathway